jgi:hypothetical protein
VSRRFCATGSLPSSGAAWLRFRVRVRTAPAAMVRAPAAGILRALGVATARGHGAEHPCGRGAKTLRGHGVVGARDRVAAILRVAGVVAAPGDVRRRPIPRVAAGGVDAAAGRRRACSPLRAAAVAAALRPAHATRQAELAAAVAPQGPSPPPDDPNSVGSISDEVAARRSCGEVLRVRSPHSG